MRLDLLVEAVAANAELLASEHGITLQVHVRERITVVGDEARMIQVIMNLLDNVICYTHPGGCVSLTVEARQGYAHFTIHDTGIGIATEHLPHIFERFYRGDPARTRAGGGSSGLG